MLNPLRPFFYLLVYIAVLYLRPQEYVQALADAPVVPVLLLSAGAFWLVAQVKNFEAPQHYLMLGLSLAMFMSVLMTGWLSGATTVLTEFAPTLLVFYITATSVDSVKRFRDVGWLLTIVSSVIAVHGIHQASTEDGIGWTGAAMIDGRITYMGLLNDPNDLSMALLMSLPFTLYVAKKTKWFVMRWACCAAAGTLLYAVYLCNSRGSVLGLLVMLSVYCVRRFGWLRSMLVGPLVLTPMLLLAPSRMSEMSADEESAAGRVDAWFEGFDMFKSHPLFGIGKGLFTDHNALTAHNSFVLAIAELGLFGYFFWLSILVVSTTMIYRILYSTEPKSTPQNPSETQPNAAPTLQWADLQNIASTLAYSMIGAMCAAFFLSRTYVVFLYLLVALVVAMYQMARQNWPQMAPVRVADMVGRLIFIEVASMVFLWVLTRILLVVS
jgi:putative inorganic carbon (hco3(-)) transporter